MMKKTILTAFAILLGSIGTMTAQVKLQPDKNGVAQQVTPFLLYITRSNPLSLSRNRLD